MNDDDIKKTRALAVSYAKTFLVNKYHDEYRELYRAYLTNRGVSIRASKVVDERQLLAEGNQS